MRVLIVFVDGVGLGSSDPTLNPIARARLPVLAGLLDGRAPVAEAAPFHGASGSLVGVDATLGVDGTPQSGTGHAALLTGEDAVRMFGRHYGPWVPTALRPLVAERSVLARAKAAGLRVAFANAYPEELALRAATEGIAGRRMGPLRSGPPLAAVGAGLLTRHTPALERGEAIASEITNEGWIRRLGRTSLPDIGPEEAGGNLARIAAVNDLTLFAHYSTDYIGHRGTIAEAVASMETVDRFLGGLLDAAPDDMLLLVVSDHGNLEDPTRQHTRNPALGVVSGRGHEEVAGGIPDLTRIAGVVLERLGAP